LAQKQRYISLRWSFIFWRLSFL